MLSLDVTFSLESSSRMRGNVEGAWAEIIGEERGIINRDRDGLEGESATHPPPTPLWGLGFTDFSISLLALYHLSSDNKCHTIVSSQ